VTSTLTQFTFKWSVNLQFLPQWVFEHRVFALLLLCAHLALLFAFLRWKWCDVIDYARVTAVRQVASVEVVKNANERWYVIKTDACMIVFIRVCVCNVVDIIHILFTSNLIGVVCARSLHYQFYSWFVAVLHYCHT
jgi:alpha-1,3-mannosyltransferase